jgi:hypothetical protein
MSVYISASYGSQITIWGIFSSGELILAAAGLSFAAIGEVLFNNNAYIRTRLAVWLVLELPPIGRSWPTTRSVLPAIVGPGLSYEPAHDDDHLRGGNPKIDDPISAFGTPHELLVGVFPGVCTLYYPALCSCQRSRLALLGDSGEQAAVLQLLSGSPRVIATVSRCTLICLGSSLQAPPRCPRSRPKAANRGDWLELRWLQAGCP